MKGNYPAEAQPAPRLPPGGAGCPPSTPPPLGTSRSDRWRPAAPPRRALPTRTKSEAAAAAAAAARARTSFLLRAAAPCDARGGAARTSGDGSIWGRPWGELAGFEAGTDQLYVACCDVGYMSNSKDRVAPRNVWHYF